MVHCITFTVVTNIVLKCVRCIFLWFCNLGAHWSLLGISSFHETTEYANASWRPTSRYILSIQVFLVHYSSSIIWLYLLFSYTVKVVQSLVSVNKTETIVWIIYDYIVLLSIVSYYHNSILRNILLFPKPLTLNPFMQEFIYFHMKPLKTLHLISWGWD